jgi:hypothetical protein
MDGDLQRVASTIELREAFILGPLGTLENEYARLFDGQGRPVFSAEGHAEKLKAIQARAAELRQEADAWQGGPRRGRPGRGHRLGQTPWPAHR